MLNQDSFYRSLTDVRNPLWGSCCLGRQVADSSSHETRTALQPYASKHEWPVHVILAVDAHICVWCVLLKPGGSREEECPLQQNYNPAIVQAET